MPSFFSSTLSIAFILCVIATLLMIFYGIEPNQITFGVITTIIGAFLTNYGVSKEPKPNTVSIADTTTGQESIENVKTAIVTDINKAKRK